MSQKVWCGGNFIQILFSLMILNDSNVIISLPVPCLSVWFHFSLKTINVQPVKGVGRGQSAFETPQHLGTVAHWFPALDSCSQKF